MEAIARFIPCNGKGDTIEGAYVRVDYNALENIIRNGINERNQNVVLETDCAEALQINKKYNIICESVDPEKNMEPFRLSIKQALTEQINGTIVHIIITGNVTKEIAA